MKKSEQQEQKKQALPEKDTPGPEDGVAGTALKEETDQKEAREETTEESKTAEEEVPTEISPLEKAERERDEFKDALIQERANFENYKRRNTAAIENTYRMAALDTAVKFLPVLDNMERALEALEDSPVKTGVELVKKELNKTFDALGVQAIDALGKTFDPAMHHAVMQVEPESGEKSGIVKSVLQKGYRADGRVLRPCIVTVTK